MLYNCDNLSTDPTYVSTRLGSKPISDEHSLYKVDLADISDADQMGSEISAVAFSRSPVEILRGIVEGIAIVLESDPAYCTQ